VTNKPKIDYSTLEELSQKAEWFLRNRGDAAVHGPYYEHQLIEYAREGRVSRASELKHATTTQGAWIPASRISAIAKLIPPTPTEPILPEPDVSTKADDLFLAIRSRTYRPSNASSSVFDVFDWSFRKYVTPWAVRAIWILIVCLWFVGFFVGIYFQASVFALNEEVKKDGSKLGIELAKALFLGGGWVVGYCLMLLLVRVALEAFIALFDIANSLKQIADKK